MTTIPTYPLPPELRYKRYRRMMAEQIGTKVRWMGRDCLVVRVGSSSATLAETGTGTGKVRLTW